MLELNVKLKMFGTHWDVLERTEQYAIDIDKSCILGHFVCPLTPNHDALEP